MKLVGDVGLRRELVAELTLEEMMAEEKWVGEMVAFQVLAV